MSLKDSKKDRDWALLNESERSREKQLRPSPQQRAIYFLIAVVTTLGVIRTYFPCLGCPFFAFFFPMFVFCFWLAFTCLCSLVRSGR